ncbi:hypothetical protein ISN44_As08g026600, partial [Arabidopsis suecica]
WLPALTVTFIVAPLPSLSPSPHAVIVAFMTIDFVKLETYIYEKEALARHHLRKLKNV